MTKKIISLILAITTILTVLIIPANAVSTVNAFNVPTSSRYAKTYTISKSGRTTPYTSKYLSTRGTTNGASSSAYIDNATDELYVMDVGVTNGRTWAYVSYPISSGRRKAYIYLSAISSASYSGSHKYYSSSSGKFYCSARKGGSSSSSYYVDRGDTVYVLSTSTSSGNYCQIMYPVSGSKWRIAWCSYSNIKTYLMNTSNSDTNKSSGSTYSVSNNVVTLKGVRLYEYPIGSKVPNGSYYFNVNGKSRYVAATQCYGFACYCEMKLYGSCYHTNPSHFPNMSGSVNVKPNESQLKSLITRAGAGAHLRTRNGHSMIIANVTNSGFTVIDANANSNCRVELRTYTWRSYLSSYFGKSGISWIEIHT